MARVNIIPAIGEGFRLIGRAPLSVLTWGLVTVGAAVLSMVLSFLLIGADMFRVFAEMAAAGEGAAPPATGFGAGGALATLLQYAIGLVSAAIVYTAVYRAVLRPEPRGFFYLRLGADEFNVGVVWLLLVVLMVLTLVSASIVIFLPLGIGFAVSAGQESGLLGMGILTFLLLVGVSLAFIALFARFGMALPMTFAEGRIRIFEAWTFTRGYGGQIFGLALLQFLLVLGLYIAGVLLVLGVALGSFATLDFANLEAALDGPQALARLMPVIGVAIVIYFVFILIMTPIMVAPWARVYALIAGVREDDKMKAFD